jgi:hypothetical protein
MSENPRQERLRKMEHSLASKFALPEPLPESMFEVVAQPQAQVHPLPQSTATVTPTAPVVASVEIKPTPAPNPDALEG